MDEQEAASEELSVTFTIMEKDIHAFMNRLLWAKFRWFVAAWSAMLCCLLCTVLTSGMPLPPQPDAAAYVRLFVPVVVFLIFPLAGWRGSLRAAVANSRKAGAFGGEHFIRITPEAVHARTPGVGESTRYWRAVHRVDAADDHVAIFVLANMAHVIPRRAFSSDEAAQQFAERAKAWQEASKKNP